MGMMHPILEYGSSVWDPYTLGLQDGLEKVQNCAAMFVTRNYTLEEGSMTGILEQLKLESLKKRRKDNQLLLLYKGQVSMAFQIPSASVEAYINVVSFLRPSGTGMTTLIP